jgi:hypothetical protein
MRNGLALLVLIAASACHRDRAEPTSTTTTTSAEILLPSADTPVIVGAPPQVTTEAPVPTVIEIQPQIVFVPIVRGTAKDESAAQTQSQSQLQAPGPTTATTAGATGSPNAMTTMQPPPARTAATSYSSFPETSFGPSTPESANGFPESSFAPPTSTPSPTPSTSRFPGSSFAGSP